MYYLLSLLLLITPALLFAAPTLLDLSFVATSFLDLVAVLLITFAVVIFLYGVGKTILNSGSAEGMQEGRKVMTYGIISLFVIVSIWGILALGRATLLNTGNVSRPTDSTLPSSEGEDTGCHSFICVDVDWVPFR